MTKRLNREQAARGLAATIRKADAAVYTVRQRERTMMPRQFARELQQAKHDGMAAIRQARAELDTAIARERQESQRTGRHSADEAARLTMYATQGMALANTGLRDLHAGIREQLAAGNQHAAREYLRAGGSRLQENLGADEYRKLQRAATPKLDAQRASLRAGLDAYAERTSRLDGHLRGLGSRLGHGDIDPDPDAQRQDLGRVVDLWHNTAEGEAAEAGVQSAESYQAAAADCGVTDI